MKFSKEPLRGMNDFYPSDFRQVNWILEIMRDIKDLYCYDEIEGPLLESVDIFAAKSSEELVNEQAFIIEKKKGERIILRPEFTPSLARMISKRIQELKKPIRWFTVPTCYRYERPQRGRRREFKQINADILGENSLYAELEIFNLLVDFLTSFGATSKQFQIYYNNRRFVDAVCKHILKIPEDKTHLVYSIIDKSEKMEVSEFEKFIRDSFEDEFIVQGIIKLKGNNSIKELLDKFDNIPEEFYKSDGYNELAFLEDLIKGNELSEYCSYSSSVVRGLDYYTGTVFEVFDTGKENRRSIAGGGRYDDLLSLFSEEKLSGIGFGMGVLMLSLFLKTYDLIPDYASKRDYTDTIYIASIDENVSNYAINISKILREEDLPCIVDYRFKNLKNQLKRANDLGVLITLIVGSKEMGLKKVSVKNMATEEQKTVNLDSLIDEIYDIIDKFEENMSNGDDE